MLSTMLDRLKSAIAAGIGAMLLRFISLSLRWRWLGLLSDPEFFHDTTPRIFAFWHSRQLLLCEVRWLRSRAGRRRPLYALISRHRDGRMIAWAVRLLGIRSVAGSSTRGGREAARELTRHLEEGADIAVTPDGPKGPVHVVKAGVVRIAQLSGALIYPMAFSAERVWRFRSWDSMILPKPFSRAAAMVGEPIRIPSKLDDAEFERYCTVVGEALQRVTAAVDSFQYASSADAAMRETGT